MTTLFVYVRIFALHVRGKEPIVELFFKGKKTLDVGCGQGDFLVKDKERFIGIDDNDELLAKARNRGAQAVKSDVKKLPFEDGGFAGAYCVNVIEHLAPADALRMLSEIARVLAPGGVLLLGSEWPSRRIWDTFSHIRPYSPTAVRKLLSREHQETFETMDAFSVEHVLYKGRFFKNSILRTLFWMPAVILPWFRHDWLMVLKKN